jgi:UDP-glucose 4-epimerase
MYQHLNGEDMTIFGDGTQTRAFSFIDDSIEPLWNSAVREEASKEIINLGGIDEISIKDVSEIVKEVIGEGNIVHLEGRHEVKHSIPTYQKSIDILGFEHKTSMKEGLTEMWKWAKEQPMKERFVWPEYELDKGIYSYWKNK